ncbi:MAG: hypothetical protein R2747_08645 [Pyrinomonadaceae bacterium]
MKTIWFLTAISTLLFGVVSVGAQDYTIARTGLAAQKKVLLLKEEKGKNDIILFETTLRVNTDGSPLSYHPQDPRGKTRALNNVCNAVAVRKAGSEENLCFSNFGEAIGVFEKWRDSGYRTVPPGYSITWKNVLSAVTENGLSVPCVFRTGPYEGYFGSLTALKNDLPGDRGECQIDDQVNPLTVPALVLIGGRNAVKDFGAKVGDLLVAYNPQTRTVVSAIIGDTGPADNLGEGSVYLNMKLLGRTRPPTNRAETREFSIADTKILVAVFPASRPFEIEGNRPYSAENIDRRVRNWQKRAGFASTDKFIETMKSFQANLD